MAEITPGISWLRQIVECLPLTMGHGAISRIAVLDAIDNVIRTDAERAERAAHPGDRLREALEAHRGLLPRCRTYEDHPTGIYKDDPNYVIGWCSEHERMEEDCRAEMVEVLALAAPRDPAPAPALDADRVLYWLASQHADPRLKEAYRLIAEYAKGGEG